MAIRITCPGCQSALTLSDAMRGKKVRCKACEKVLSIPAAGKAKSLAAEESEENALQDRPRLKAPKAAAPPEDNADSDDGDRPAKKKKKKKKGKKGSGVLIIGAIAAVFVLLITGGVLAAVIHFKSEQKLREAPVARAPEAKEKDDRPPQRIVVPGIKEGNPAAKKGGAGIVSNVRGAAYRTERQSELKQIGALFIAFSDEYKGPSRTLDNFLKSIKQNSGPIHDYIKEGYYQMNMNARLEGSSVICYERDMYAQGYQCVMGSGEVKDISDAELKAALGK